MVYCVIFSVKGHIEFVYTYSDLNTAEEKFLSVCKDLGWDGVHNEAEKLIENKHYKTGILEVILIDSLFNYN